MSVHTADTDKTALFCLVLSMSAVWKKLATIQDFRRQRISKLFCPVSKCSEVYWKQSWLVTNSGHITDKTRQDSHILSYRYSVNWALDLLLETQFCHHNLTREAVVAVNAPSQQINIVEFTSSYQPMPLRLMSKIHSIVSFCHSDERDGGEG